MYCSLEDAFPQKLKNQATDQKKTFPSSCWHSAPAPESPVMGANVQMKTPVAPMASGAQGAYGAHSAHKDDKCFSALHHCLSCPTCQRLLALHFQAADNQAPVQGTPIVVGAQVGRRQSSRPSRRRRSHRRRVIQGATAILNEPISVGSNITWGHILVLVVGGAFLLLIVDRLKK